MPSRERVWTAIAATLFLIVAISISLPGIVIAGGLIAVVLTWRRRLPRGRRRNL